jgi:hypothetical protein
LLLGRTFLHPTPLQLSQRRRNPFQGQSRGSAGHAQHWGVDPQRQLSGDCGERGEEEGVCGQLRRDD